MEKQYLLILTAIVLLFLIVNVCQWFRKNTVCYPKGVTGTVLHQSKPKIIKLHNFMTPEECNHIIELCQDRFQRSNVMKDDGGNKEDDLRTSSSCFLKACETPIIKQIERKAARLTGVSLNQIEPLQVVRYYPGQKYDAHNDWFHLKGVTNQRYKTILAYLNDDFTGGSTDFVNIGVSSGQPKKGDAIMWDNCTRNNTKSCHKDAMHRGSPPDTGIKYALNIWVRFKNYRNGKSFPS